MRCKAEAAGGVKLAYPSGRTRNRRWMRPSKAEVAARRAEMARLFAEPDDEDADPEFRADLQLAHELVSHPGRSNSRRAYDSDERDYNRYFEKQGRDSLRPTMGTFCAFFASLTKRKKRDETIGLLYETIKRKAWGVDRMFRRHGLISPVSTKEFWDFMERLREKCPRRPTKKAAPFCGEVATNVIDSLDIKNEPRDARDNGVFVVGSERGFRSETIAAMKIERIKIVGKNLAMSFDTVKNSGKREEVIVKIGHRRGGPKKCAHCAILLIKETFGFTSGPLFRHIDRWGHIYGGLSERAITDILRKRVAAVGVDPQKYTSHGIRRGRFRIEWTHKPGDIKNVMDVTGIRDPRMLKRYLDEFGSVVTMPSAALTDAMPSK